MTDSEKPTPDDLPSAGRPMAGKPGAGESPTVRLSHPTPQPAADPPQAEQPTAPIAVPARSSGNPADEEPTAINPSSPGADEWTAGDSPHSDDEPTVMNAPPPARAEEWRPGAAPEGGDDEPTVINAPRPAEAAQWTPGGSLQGDEPTMITPASAASRTPGSGPSHPDNDAALRWIADSDSVPSAGRTRPSEWPQPAQWPQAAEPPEGYDPGETWEGGSVPGAAAVDDEPTVERIEPPRRTGDDLGGETVRLRPPPVIAPDPAGARAEQDQPGASRPKQGRPGASDPEHSQVGAADVEQSEPAASGPQHSQVGAADMEQSEPAASGPEQGQPGGRREGPIGEPAGSLDPVIRGAGGGSDDVRDSVPVQKDGLVRAPDPDGLIVLPETAAGQTGENTVQASWRKLSSASALIWVLLALFGFTLVVQLRSNDTDQGLATARQEDLVRILSDLEARDTRLSAEISTLEQSQRQLTSGVAGRQAALAEADKRADELGLLAGTLPGRGPGLRIAIDPKTGTIKASAILNAVQELRGAGGEVMELVGSDGTAVRIVASTYFVDVGGGGIIADGARLTGPYTLWVIGSPQTMQTALQIPGGVVASVESAGGSVTMDQRSLVEVTAVRKATSLQYARPVS
jgi:uncharacterized protein YlxW (UPF0749 family)